MGDEVFVPFPATVRPLRLVRSTLLSSSLAALRKHGFADRYFQSLPAEHHPAILSLVAGVWVPVELARAHYEACDRLGLGAQEMQPISDDVTQRIQGSVLATVVRLAASTGVTMWTGLAQFPRLWERMFQGSGVRILKLGPKDAKVETAEQPLATLSYFRNGLRHTVRATCELFARTVHVRDVTRPGSGDAAFRLSWV